MLRSKVLNKSLRVADNFTEDNITVKGYLEVGRRAVINDFSILGTLKAGDIESNHFDNRGFIDCSHSIQCKKIENYGTIRTEEILGGYIHNEGSILADKLVCTNFSGYGELKVKEIKTEDSFQFMNEGSSTINTIAAKNVHVMTKQEYRKLVSKHHKSNNTSADEIKLLIYHIQGDNVTIADAAVNKVEGKNVVVNENCVVEQLFYTETYTLHESSTVKSFIHI